MRFRRIFTIRDGRLFFIARPEHAVWDELTHAWPKTIF
jgi:hypothetical protein